MSEKSSINEVLQDARRKLDRAREGLRSAHDHRSKGLHDVAVFGRAVTTALQHLRRYDPEGFDQWYGPWMQEMDAEPLFTFFNDLRTDVLDKRGASTSPLPQPPTTAFGLELADTSFEHLASLYLDYLEKLLQRAERWFGSSSAHQS